MNLSIRIALISGLLAGLVYSQTITVGDTIHQNTTWDADVVEVESELVLPMGVELTINPGTRVVFKGHYKFKVNGTLFAKGTDQDSIFFTAQDSSVGWHGLRFEFNEDTSYVSFCRIEFGKGSAKGDIMDIYGGAIFISSYSPVVIEHSSIVNNSTGTGGGIHSINGSVIIRNCFIKGNIAGAGAGISISARRNPPVIEGNIICDNISTGTGGGINFSIGSSAYIIGNIIYNNTAESRGGGLRLNESSPTLINNLIYDNESERGGGIDCYKSSPRIINCTIAKNRANYGGGLHAEEFDARPELVNTIIWQNAAEYNGNEVYLNAAPLMTITNCSILNYPHSDYHFPGFVDDENSDYSMAENSNCRDKGTTDTSGLGLPATDIAGKPRIDNGRVDIGAYEFQDGTPMVFPGASHGAGVRLAAERVDGSIRLWLIGPWSTSQITPLEILDPMGRLFRLVEGATLPGASATYHWDLTGNDGSAAPPGAYFFVLEDKEARLTARAVIE